MFIVCFNITHGVYAIFLSESDNLYWFPVDSDIHVHVLQGITSIKLYEIVGDTCCSPCIYRKHCCSTYLQLELLIFSIPSSGKPLKQCHLHVGSNS